MDDIRVLLALIVIQWGFIIYQKIQFNKMLKDLLNRILAKDMREYVEIENPPPIRKRKVGSILKDDDIRSIMR